MFTQLVHLSRLGGSGNRTLVLTSCVGGQRGYYYTTDLENVENFVIAGTKSLSIHEDSHSHGNTRFTATIVANSLDEKAIRRNNIHLQGRSLRGGTCPPPPPKKIFGQRHIKSNNFRNFRSYLPLISKLLN